MSTDTRSTSRERDLTATGGGEDRLRRSTWRWIRLATILACLWLGCQVLLAVQGRVLRVPRWLAGLEDAHRRSVEPVPQARGSRWGREQRP